jgi:hypothetical protein
MTPEQIHHEYWLSNFTDIGKTFINGNIVWTHSNIAKFFESQGLTTDAVKPHIGEGIIYALCGTCSAAELPFSATSRGRLVELKKRLDQGSGRCPECWAEQQEAAKVAKALTAEKEKADAEKAAVEKLIQLETYRKSLVLKHGVLATDTLCVCGEGYLVVRFASGQGRCFLGCSRYNPYKYSCDHTQPLAPEFWGKYLPIFQARLDGAKTMAVVA